MPQKIIIEYRDGREVARRVIEISDADAARETIPQQLRNSIARLDAIITQGDALAGQSTAPTAAQIRGMAAAMADIARGLRWLIVREFD